MSTVLQAFLDEHPLTETVDILIPDLVGIARGKRLPIAGLSEALAGNSFFTTSIYALDTTGQNVDKSGIVWEEGDADRAVRLDERTLRPVPWRGGGAQVLGGVLDHGGGPFFADVRELLRRLQARFAALGLSPVAAIELEFHLLDDELLPSGQPQVPRMPRLGARSRETDVFVLERMDDQERFFDLVDQFCAVQGIRSKGALCEFAPSQFEINLAHGSDMPAVADEALMLKRCIKAAARATGQRATFMAKPFAEQSGSGLHVHLSLCDRDGRNLFGEAADGDRLLRHVIGGLQATMAEAMAILAPNANSFRRLQPLSYAPTAATWGENNRTVALRIPPGPPPARRIEHRVAGADANPYLVLAVVLAGTLYGLENRLEPGPPTIGSAYEQPNAAPLPLDWGAAVAAMRSAEVLPDLLDRRLWELYAAGRASERARFRAHVTPLEHLWYMAAV